MAADDHIAYEQACEWFTELHAKLRAGARGAGVTLTSEECDQLVCFLALPTRLKGRPPKDDNNPYIAIHCFKRERTEPLKTAVANTAEVFGCSIKTVYAARAASIKYAAARKAPRSSK